MRRSWNDRKLPRVTYDGLKYGYFDPALKLGHVKTFNFFLDDSIVNVPKSLL